ncbi:MAG: hypothetical protein ABJL54_12560 [Halioglobus sp.]
MIDRNQSSVAMRTALAMLLVIAAAAFESNPSRADAQGDLGKLSRGSSEIYLIIIQPAKILAPASFFAIAGPIAKGNSNTVSGAAAAALIARESRNFDLNELETRSWLTQELRENGVAEFDVCIPEGRGEISLLPSNSTQSLLVEFSKSDSGNTADSSESCSGGSKTTINISMSPHRTETNNVLLSAGTDTQVSRNISTPINLIIVPR